MFLYYFLCLEWLYLYIYSWQFGTNILTYNLVLGCDLVFRVDVTVSFKASKAVLSLDSKTPSQISDINPFRQLQYVSFNSSLLTLAGACCFHSKYFFERKIFNSVVGVFFLFLKLPMTRRVQVCRVGVLYNKSVGCHRGSGDRGDGFESLYRPNFSRLSG